MRIIPKYIKAETAINLLVAIVLFSILFLSYSQWQSIQNQRLEKQYQEQIAWQVAENQLALKMAGMDCKGEDRQQNLQIQIECSDNHIKVRFPLGEIVVDKP